MSRYKKYSNYRESQLQLIGKIPTHWIPTKLKFIGVLKGGAGFPHEEQGIATEALDFHKVNALAKANSEGIIEKSENTISVETAKKLGAFVFPRHSIVFAKVGAALLLSRIRMLINPACIDNNLMGFVVHEYYAIDFIKYAMELIKFDLIVNPGAIPSLNESQIGNYSLVIPSKTEQVQIANFLDHETAKIDTLIAKQQELIKLLKEKRQAVISHAVTKGLNPNSRMRDSGVEWLGEVPEHWIVSRLKFNCNVKGRIGFRGYTVDDLVERDSGALVIGASEMTKSGDLTMDSCPSISWRKYYESPEIMLNGGMLLFVQRGSTVGKVAYVPDNLGPATINPSLIVLREIAVRPQFLKYCLMSSAIQTLVKVQTSTTAIPMISQEQVGNYWQCIPPVQEQREIEIHIQVYIEGLDAAISTCIKSIELSQERRTALISAAVTGKIDVRDWQAPSETALTA